MPSRERHKALFDAESLEPNLDFMRLLWRIEHSLQSRSKHMEAAIGVTGPQRLVLRVVDRYPGLSAGELARIIRLHPSTLTGVIQRLVEKELLQRVADTGDRRRQLLRVRREARRYTRRSEGTIESDIARVLSRLSAVDVRCTRRVLTAIATALETD
jgi:DNA-binding MarR family transcriptional regulator